MQAFLDDLGFERFGVRAALAHGNPGDKGDRVRLKIRGHHRPKYWSSVGVFAIRLRLIFLRAKQNPYLHTQIGVSEFNLDDDLLSHGETPH
ncbi:hypothetical protein, partial [Pseudomonas sp. NPDC086278]|uniref:hypothetical protein n=1 Tax=Pseudomonas sp. NPDC086278 TaxID=3390646 RepID=UPI003D00DE7E